MSSRTFNAGEPLAYFLTWTSFGTWLPVDERGWIEKDRPGVQPPNPLFAQVNSTRMRDTPFWMSVADRSIVEQTIAEHCDIRRWYLHAVQARTNHVHVVVSAAAVRPETVLDQFKAWCTRQLKESNPARTRFWTEGGSRRWLNTEGHLEAAINYVLEAQDRKGREDS